MGLLSDWQIKQRLTLNDENRLRIDPFEPEQISRAGVVSFGLASYGYDVRLGRTYRVIDRVDGLVIDPVTWKADLEKCEARGLLKKFTAESVLIPPNGFVLGESVERFRIPRDVLAIVMCKSTLARLGVGMPMTPLEPEWEGIVTIEIVNHTPNWIRLHAGMGIGQILFVTGNANCDVSYADKKRPRYQNQTGLTDASTS